MKVDNPHIPARPGGISPDTRLRTKFLPARKAGISDPRREALFSELNSLLSSGMDFNRAFGMLVQGERDKDTKALLGQIHGNVIKGDPLWRTLEKCGRFSALDCGVVRIGEETGKLNESLGFLSEYYRKKAAQKRMVSSAVSYPLIIMAVAVVVLIFMVTVVVPMFEQVYSRMGGELPSVTQAVIRFSRNFKNYFFVFAAVCVALAVLIALYKNTDAWQRFRTTLLLRIPVVKDLLRKHYQGHFCKLMYLLCSSGVPLLQGIRMLEGIITFYPYRRSFAEISDNLNGGGSFSDSMAKFPNLYEAKLVTLLKVGEETNTLPQMLERQGETLSVELEHRLKQLGNLLEPLMIMFVGVLVATVLISMYLPMFKLGTTIY